MLGCCSPCMRWVSALLFLSVMLPCSLFSLSLPFTLFLSHPCGQTRTGTNNKQANKKTGGQSCNVALSATFLCISRPSVSTPFFCMPRKKNANCTVMLSQSPTPSIIGHISVPFFPNRFVHLLSLLIPADVLMILAHANAHP